MRDPLRSRSSRGLIASLLASALCAAPPASAEIFKCFAKDKTPIYQNFPCQFESIDSMPSNLQPERMTVVPTGVSQANPKAAPVNVASTVQAADPGEPRVGMAHDEVRALLGEPMEIVQDEPTKGVETWRYVNRRIQFDRAKRVVELQAW
jgi:outer membrane protein assembly factor BamE (lipoprotein component of BamABCDE complex)